MLGLSDEIADAPTEHDVQVELYPIWPDNQRAVELFLELAPQWDRVAEVDGELTRIRLRWDSVEILLRHTNGIPRRDWPQLFNALRIMERAALSAMNDERNKRRERREEERMAKQ